MQSLPLLHPDDAPMRQQDLLKPGTQQLCAMAHWRRRSRTPLPESLVVIPYHYQTHGTDVLLYWYAMVRQENSGEHMLLWGTEMGGSPSRFVAEMSQCEVVFLVDGDSNWLQGEGILGAVWGDDRCPPTRQRIHFWAAPPYRHPQSTDRLATHALDYLFACYHLLWGLTPVTMPLAVRAVRRWGFQQVGVLPQGMDESGAFVDGVISAQTRHEWSRRHGG